MLRWMEHAEDEEYSLLGEPEVRTARTGSTVTASQEDIDRAGEMAEHYEQSGALQGMNFLGVRDEFEAVSRSLDTFYFQDLAKMNHTFDAYPWLDNSAYPIFVTYFVEKQDGTFRRVGGESLMVDKDPDIYGAEVTVFHPTGLTCEEGWYTTGSSPEICENAEKIPVRPEQIQGDERCVFRSVGSHLYVYMKKDTFTHSYMDIDEDGWDLVYRTENVKYKQEVSMTYEPERREIPFLPAGSAREKRAVLPDILWKTAEQGRRLHWRKKRKKILLLCITGKRRTFPRRGIRKRPQRSWSELRRRESRCFCCWRSERKRGWLLNKSRPF